MTRPLFRQALGALALATPSERSSGPRGLISWASLRHSLTLRVTAAYVLFGLAILAGVATFAFYNGRAALERTTISGLTALAAEKEERIKGWFAQKTSEIETIAVSPYLVTGIPAVFSAGKNRAEGDAVRDRLNDFLSKVWLQTGRAFVSLYVLDPETGKVIVATNPSDLGKYREDRPVFLEGKKAAYVEGPYYSVPEGGPSIVFSAPVKEADGKLLGVVVGRADIAELQGIIERDTEGHSTDDNFIVNDAGLYVTQPRYILDQVTLRFGTQSPYLRQCLAGDSGVALTDDYRAVPVIAIYRWIPTRRFCLIAKVDQAEALEPILTFRNSILLLGLLGLVIASVIAVGLARSITRPIKELQAGVERLGRGERDVHLRERSQDELGLLAREFNHMAGALAAQEIELREQAQALQVVNAKLTGTNAELESENIERRRAESEVRTLNDELERRVLARTTELATVNHELEAFVYSVSHDLRAPLRHMDGFSQALVEDYGDKLDDGAKNFLSRIRNASVRMGRLIDDLLELSRVSRGQFEHADVDLSAIAQQIVDTLRQGEPARTVAVDIAPGAMAWASGRLMAVALENLLGNAWKFTAKNPAARISFGIAEQRGRPAYFVRDNGVGFDMAYVHKLFAPFQRLHRNEEFEGTGIGLATVSRIIHRHGGEVWIEAAVGQGTTVYFTLSGRTGEA
ncbi:hypothetical protein GCM10011611_18600 [Aliidongia dinghuensis]|uniref:histidine kinase n=1 Tax=Aliidongia dinghuensis TaxID=1867774 RepID=A0A8J3E1L7_9PROT|nr:ATP-binding protein [Aliidongia dinghuensis]GGF13171.1 hypothetical protein GCM10011611_18600 [Aliidongia dinghuensis]